MYCGVCVCAAGAVHGWADLLKCLEGESKLPQAESGLELRDGGESVQKLLSRAQREVRVLCSCISDLVLLVFGW